MSEKKVCECKESDYWWFCTDKASCNENGWKCINCEGYVPGEPAGFSPKLDRKRINDKVFAVLEDMSENGASIVYVGSGSHGEDIVGTVAKRCKKEGRFDQYSIAFFILDCMTPGHAEYWKNISDGIMEGNDPRDRCECGKLANRWVNSKHYCRDHEPAMSATV